MKAEFDSASNDRVLAVLYGEDGASQSLSASEAADVTALGEVRSMFADALDKEPPSAISAQLLLAAAQQAQASVKPASAKPIARREATDTWWAGITRWFEPLFRHPGLAAAASLTLVATLGGVLYIKGRAKVAHPPASATAAAPATVSDQSLAPPKSNQIEAVTPELSGGSKSLSDSTSVDDLAKSAVSSKNSKASTSAGVGKPSTNSQYGKEKEKADVRRRISPKRAQKQRASKKKLSRPRVNPAPKSEPAQLGSAPSSTTNANRRESSASEPVQASESQSEDTDTRSENVRSGGDAAEQEPLDLAPAPAPVQKRPQRSLADFRRRAAAAAEKGDCRAARTLGKTVRQRDQRYYETVFVRDRDIRRCYKK